MKILLFGKNGQVGWELQRALSPLGTLVMPGRHDTPLGGDLADADRIAATIQSVRPDIIVNAAAHTAVDRAESEPEPARALNAEAPGRMAVEAEAARALLVHFSTDYVFDGAGHEPRDEEAATSPLNIYGRTKLDGEQRIRASGCKHLILRTSWVYAARGGNFARTMLRLAREREQLAVIDDQVGAPTGAELLADVTAHLVRAVRERQELEGTYHVVAAGETSWHGYARFVIEWARAQGLAVRVSPDAIQAVPTQTYPTPARRPLNSRLSTKKLSDRFGLVMPPWQIGVERMLVEAFLRQGDPTER